MKKVKYTIKLLSSLIISPRSGQALYKEIDEFCEEPKLETLEKEQTAKIVYPFYQYGGYEKYDPKYAEYYLPGSSIKGAIRSEEGKEDCLMVDDLVIPNERIVLRNLRKAQHLKGKKQAKFDIFFENVGVEMVKARTVLEGELYLKEDTEFSEILYYANKLTKQKMNQMCKYLSWLLQDTEIKGDIRKYLEQILKKLSSIAKRNDIILIGGYKGLFHTMVLQGSIDKISGGIFIDKETLLPHGIVELKACTN